MRTNNRSIDEQATLQAARSGDLTAFNQLIERYQSMAYSVAYRILHNEDDATDALQTSFLNAFRKLDRLEGDNFKSWLMRIVVNRCYDILRSRKRQMTTSLDDGFEHGEEEASEWIDSGELPETFAERSELNRTINAGLKTLREEHRTVLVLADVHGYAYDEIATTLGWPIGTVKSNLNRARAKLRDYLLRRSDLLPASFRHKSEASAVFNNLQLQFAAN